MKALTFFAPVLLLGFALAADSAEPKQAGRKPAIVVSKETTYLTSPLRKDGSVDYVAAINAEYSRGVTTRNNGAIPFWKAFGPSTIPKEFRAEFFKRLNVKPLPEKGAYFAPIETLLGDLRGKQRDDADYKLQNKFDEECAEKPWKAEQHPRISKWLNKNARALQLVAIAARKPRFFHPLILNPKDMGIGIGFQGTLSPLLKAARNAARSLQARVMLHIGHSRYDDAIIDLETIHLLARQIDGQPPPSAGFVAVAMRAVHFQGFQSLVSTTSLSRKQLRQLQTHFVKHPPSDQVFKQFGHFGRMHDLIGLRFIAEGRMSSLQSYGWFVSKKKRALWRTHGKKVALKMVDWNAVMRHRNTTLVAVLKIARMPDRSKREAAFKKYEAAVTERLEKNLEFEKWISGPADDKKSQNAATLWFSWAGTKFSLPAFRQLAIMVGQDRARGDLIRTALSFAAFHHDKGRYPLKLADLVPRYLKAVPIDSCDGKPMRYKRQGKGYLLYSVGSNGKDEEGRPRTQTDFLVDDIAIRVK